MVAAPNRDQNYDISALRILLADPIFEMSNLLRSILREFHVMGVRTANTPEMAYDIFRRDPADLIITDWFPSFDGLALVKAVRAKIDSPEPFVPVIIATAHTELNRVIEARDAGMHELLAKPFSATSLYQRIKLVVEHNRQFVRCKGYIGPDRRRHATEFEGEERRKATDDLTSELEPSTATNPSKTETTT